MKNTLFNSKVKTIEKLINSGIDSDEKIKKMTIDDIWKIKGLTGNDISNIKHLREAIKEKDLIAFFNELDFKGGDS